MKIVMLGHTGVGKTTYIASLYGIMQQSIEGFRLRAVESDEHKRWINIAERIQQGEYPLGTDRRQEYNFYLRYQGRNILQFSWADYRGGALRETQDSEQAKALLTDLKAADGLILFCDCHALASGDTRSNQIGRMTSLASQALKELDHPLSLAIVLTKTDLLTSFPDDMLKSLGGLIAAINASDLVLGALIPIACSSRLCNVPMPLLFVLYSAVAFEATSAYKEAESHDLRAQSYEKFSQGFAGAVDWVVSKISQEPTYGEMATNEREKAIVKKRLFAEIQKPGLLLHNYVQKLPRIQSSLAETDYIKQLSNIKEGMLENAIASLDPFSIF